MNFATKIFLSILITAVLATISVSFSMYSIFKKNIELEFANRYQAYGNTIASTFHNLEIASDRANKNAVLLLSEIESRKGIPTDSELDALANKFGVNGFYVIDKNGKFLRSSDISIKKQINSLFSYSSDYQLLVTGDMKIAITPIIPSYPYDVPTKLTMIPNHNKTLILESSTHLEYISKFLHQIIAADENIKSVGLYASTGYELGSISSSGKFNQGRRNAVNNFDLSFTNKFIKDNYIFSIKVPTTVENCPECIQKGVSTDGKYHYILRIEVSLIPLLARLNALKTEMIFIFSFILIVGFFISIFISRKLVNRIYLINSTANKIIKTKNLDLKVITHGNDEIAKLASTLNAMIKELKNSQDNLIETEKARSITKIAAQLCNDPAQSAQLKQLI